MKTKRITRAITLTLGDDVIAWLTRIAIERKSSASQVVREMVANAMRADQEAEAKGRAQPAVVMTARRGHASEVTINRVRR